MPRDVVPSSTTNDVEAAHGPPPLLVYVMSVA